MARVNLDTTEVLDITCRQGDTFELTITLKDSSGVGLNLVTDNYSFIAQVRGASSTGRSRTSRTPRESGLIVGSSELGEKGEVNFQFNNKDDNGNVTLFISAADMRQVPAGRYRYDLQYVTGETHKTVLKGAFVVNPDISKVQ